MDMLCGTESGPTAGAGNAVVAITSLSPLSFGAEEARDVEDRKRARCVARKEEVASGEAGILRWRDRVGDGEAVQPRGQQQADVLGRDVLLNKRGHRAVPACSNGA